MSGGAGATLAPGRRHPLDGAVRDGAERRTELGDPGSRAC